MEDIQILVILDGAVVIIMMVLASLSKRLGEALKIPEFYKAFYVCSALVVGAAILSIVSSSTGAINSLVISRFIPEGMRTAAGIVAAITCLPYWKWLFPEQFKR